MTLTRLCAAQLCERFGFFAILPLFVLYLHHRQGWSEPSAMLLLGVFQALCYVGALPAGALADRRIGAAAGARLGAVLLTLGYGALALDRPSLLWPAFAVMVVGHSFFKPSMGTLIGGLYPQDLGLRERAFQLQYLAINVGAMVGPLGSEWSHAHNSWAGVFLWCFISTGLGALVLFSGSLGDPPRTPRPVEASAGTPASDSHRMRLVWLICSLAVIFWLTAQQAGSSLALFADQHTQLRIALGGYSLILGPGHFTSLHCLLVLVLLPLFIVLTSWLRRRAAEPSTQWKMTAGYVATAAAFVLLALAGLRGGDTGVVSPAWLAGCYFFISVGEVLLAPLGVSLVTQIAPPDKTTLAIGLWFSATAAGNILTGAVGQLWDRWPPHRYFAGLAILSLAAGAVLVTRRRQLAEVLQQSLTNR
jgi:POT family proton-dependent oligopeptide transporter